VKNKQYDMNGRKIKTNENNSNLELNDVPGNDYRSSEIMIGS
jgi:hypothetical protein